MPITSIKHWFGSGEDSSGHQQGNNLGKGVASAVQSAANRVMSANSRGQVSNMVSNSSGGYAGSTGNNAMSFAGNYGSDLMDYVVSAREANEFSALEAQKNRDWQERMSNTAHQREVKDLQAAGLNPVLSAGGSGAAVTSGATAQAHDDTSLLNTLIAATSGVQQAKISAGAMAYSAAMNYAAQKYSSDMHVMATGMNNATSKYIAKQNNLTKTITSIGNGIAHILAAGL